MEWQQFVMNLETLNPASVEEILIRHGAQSVTFTDAGDRPVLEPGPRISEHDRLCAVPMCWSRLPTAMGIRSG